MTQAVRLFFAVALILSGCLAAARAQTAPAARQEPPPVADPGTTGQSKCIEENDGFKMRGKQPIFMIELANKCEQRIKCKVFVYMTSAKGASQARGTIVLGARSSGTAAKKSFTMRTKMNGGSAQSARECRAL
jgi:hypothetical protein